MVSMAAGSRGARWKGTLVQNPAPVPIQVCAGADSTAAMEREIRALQSALPEPRRARATVITLHPETFSTVPRGITVIREVEWLLDPP